MIPYGREYTDENGEPFESRVDRLLDALVATEGLDAVPAQRSLVGDVLYFDSIVWLQGRPGSAKSFAALDLAGCVATGQPWQGFPVAGDPTDPTITLDVLYVVAEGLSGLRPRVRAWEAAMGRSMEYVWFLPMALQSSNATDWAALVEMAGGGINGGRFGLIVLDTQARLTVGMEENSARDMGVWVAQLERLRAATGACVLVVHHQGRNGEHMRGSTAMEGAATTIIQVSKDEELVTVRCLKQKDAPEFDDIHLRLVPYADSAVLALTDGRRTGSATSQARRWLTAWEEMHGGDPVSISVLTKSGVVSETTFHRTKLALIDEGAVERKGDGNSVRYRLLWRASTGLPTPTPKGVGVGGSQSRSHGTPTGAWESEVGDQ